MSSEKIEKRFEKAIKELQKCEDWVSTNAMIHLLHKLELYVLREIGKNE